MSWTLRLRTTAYDNIANGSASGKERTIAGNGGTTEAYGGLDRAGVGTSWHTSRVQDNLQLATSPSQPSNATYQHLIEDVISTS